MAGGQKNRSGAAGRRDRKRFLLRQAATGYDAADRKGNIGAMKTMVNSFVRRRRAATRSMQLFVVKKCANDIIKHHQSEELLSQCEEFPSFSIAGGFVC
jgi:hypothetical protein